MGMEDLSIDITYHPCQFSLGSTFNRSTVKFCHVVHMYTYIFVTCLVRMYFDVIISFLCNLRIKTIIEIHSWALSPLSVHSDIGLSPIQYHSDILSPILNSHFQRYPNAIFENFIICLVSTYFVAYISGKIPDSSCGRYGTFLLFRISDNGLI